MLRVKNKSFFEKRVFFEILHDEKPIEGGICCHSWLAFFLVKIFGSGIEKYKDDSNRVIYLNKGSYEKWKKSHQHLLKPVIACKSRFSIDSKYADAYLHDEAKLGSLASWVN